MLDPASTLGEAEAIWVLVYVARSEKDAEEALLAVRGTGRKPPPDFSVPWYARRVWMSQLPIHPEEWRKVLIDPKDDLHRGFRKIDWLDGLRDARSPGVEVHEATDALMEHEKPHILHGKLAGEPFDMPCETLLAHSSAEIDKLREQLSALWHAHLCPYDHCERCVKDESIIKAIRDDLGGVERIRADLGVKP